jgi:uncharacterized membrane protein required for colicin V production
MGYNIVDAGIAIFLIGGLIGGLRRGLSGELSRVLIAAGCITIVYFYSRTLADWLITKHNFSSEVALLIAAAALLLGAYIALTLVRIALAAVFSFTFKGRLERIGGAICGTLRTALAAAILLTMLALLPNETLRRHIAVESRLGSWVVSRMHPLIDRVADRFPALDIPNATEGAFYDESVEWKDGAPLDWDTEPLGPAR